MSIFKSRKINWLLAFLQKSVKSAIMKSIFHIRSMQLQDDGLYTALLIKVFASFLALRLQAQGVFSKLTITQIMRKLRREEDLREFLTTHFHTPFSIT